MDIFDLQAFRATPLEREPYEHLVVPRFVKAEALRAINADYPEIEHSGSFPLASLTFGPRFQQVAEALDSAEFRLAFEEKFGIDLADRPTTITVRGRCSAHDGKTHTDSTGKIITVLLYMNPAWDDSGGRLRILRSNRLDDFVAEVPPSDGALVAFLRSDRSWHGHLPFEGPRRVIQFNWVTGAGSRHLVMLRHRVSASVKHVLTAVGLTKAAKPASM